MAVTSVCAIIALYAVSKLYAYLFATSGISLPKIDFDRFLSAYEYASNVIFSQGMRRGKMARREFYLHPVDTKVVGARQECCQSG